MTTYELDEPTRIIVGQAVQAWLNYEADAHPDVGFPLKAAPPEFRKSRTADEWESSWGYNVPYADVDRAACQAVLDGTSGGCAIGDFALRPRPGDKFGIGCLRVSRETAQWLLDNTP